jgi:Holliday junction DNA helicase RuvA
MIGSLRGKVTYIGTEYCFLDVQGVGYRIFIPLSTRQQLAVEGEVVLLTHLSVREDALLLYGFSTKEEYELFQQLIGISGIGPKVALGVLSAITPGDFFLAVCGNDAALLTRIPGIGKKTAERLILELKDKIGPLASRGETFQPVGGIAGTNKELDEALQAMLALGYSQAEILPVIKQVRSEGQTVAELVKLALKELGRR